MERYDRMPYRGGAIHDTHPNQIAAIAWLHGLSAPPPQRCRVLELGCGRGSNLLPMAWSLPEARFVGIDTASTQVDEARDRAAQIGLDNVAFQVADILDFEAAERSFDYIIAHGVMSWVPLEVQGALLQICARSLSDDGVAYISYNTLPGWHFRGGMRDLLRFHTEARDDPETQVREARSLLDLYAELSGDDPYGRLVRREAELVRRFPPWYLFHDHLADLNRPFYVRAFVRWAEEAGLRYLADAERDFKHVRPEVRERLRALSEDRLRRMQYEDFLLNRSFRCSLLVHAARMPAPEPQHERIRDLWVSGLTRPEDGALADLSSTAMVGYTTPEKKRFQAGAPVVKAALQVLFELWPGSTPFESLYREARRRLGRSDNGDDEERNLLTKSVFEGFRAAFFQLTVHPERLATEISAHPVAIPLARLQAASTEPWITNAMHSEIKLGALSRRLLVHLDGRDRAALLDALMGDHRSGDLVIRTQDGEPVVAPEVAQELLDEALDQHLEILARFAMLAS